MMQLSIIIVNYRSCRLIVDCVRSIKEETTHIAYEIIVVDNNSGDDSEKVLMTQFPQIRYLQMTYNTGFARANNEGIRQSKGAVILLLNPDTLIENNAIEKCYHQFIQSRYVACGVQLLNPDRTPQISGNFFMKGSLNNLLPLPYIGNSIKWLGNLVNVKKPNIPDAGNETAVDWINGAFLMVKKEVISKVGLMDDDFFLYAEETEWCSRLRKAGQLCIYGQYKVIHLQGETANETFGSSGKGYYNLYDRKGLQILVSNFVRIRKQLGTGWFFFHLFMYTLTIPVFFIASLLENIFKFHSPFREFPRAGKMAANIFRLWLLVPRIVANKPYFYKIL